MSLKSLIGLTRSRLAEELIQAGVDPKAARMRSGQLWHWIYQRGATSFDEMTNVSKVLRADLAERFTLARPEIAAAQISEDGTRKWLLRFGPGIEVETVFIPEADRGTLCVSTQAGCAVNCRFCSTGKQGFSRNLEAHEIVAQIWHANRALGAGDPARRARGERPISNVVFMGMGEPLQNYAATLAALRILLDDHAYGLSRRRVTVSTSGVVPMIDRLRDDCPVALAISLHAPDDALRDELVPLNRKYPLTELMAACRRYLERAPRDFITFEYVMLDGVNDSDRHVEQLLALVRDVPCKFNLIPFNPFPNSGLRRSSPERIRRFAQRLAEAGIVATTRRTRGDDIDAACGQLAGEVRDRTRLEQRTARAVRAGEAAEAR